MSLCLVRRAHETAYRRWSRYVKKILKVQSETFARTERLPKVPISAMGALGCLTADLQNSQGVTTLSGFVAALSLGSDLSRKCITKLLSLRRNSFMLREASLWFRSTQGRQNGRTGAKKSKQTRKKAQRRSGRRPNRSKIKNFMLIGDLI